MTTSKAYSAVPVNHVALEQLTPGRQGLDVVVGLDIGKYHILAVPRFADGHFARPWRVAAPQQLPALLALLLRLAAGRSLRVALESSGTYGDPLRQALHDAGLPVLRVSPKAAHDYAEVFDGVPSQHDGKDAAVVAELAGLGKATPWPYEVPPAWEQELAYWVDWLEAQRRLLAVWSGRLEALLARHWPEATGVLGLTSAALLQALAHYGGPAALAADGEAAARLGQWGGRWLDGGKVQRLLESARQSLGVRQTEVDLRQVQQYARQALLARQQVRQGRGQLRGLVRGREVLEAQARVVGCGTACALWACVGDPRGYPCGQAYRKAMGLNLTERSSGTARGKLHLSKRGDPRARRWLYLAALRLLKRPEVRRWYDAKKGRDGGGGKRAAVGVMRKLVLALYRVGVSGARFEAGRLFPGAARPGAGPAGVPG